MFLNCEELAVREWCKSPAMFLGDVKESFPGVGLVFFDEVQRLEGAGLVLKGLADARQGLTFVATGSSSYEAKEGTRESIAGRATRLSLYPFSLRELSPRGVEGAGVVQDEALGETCRRQLVAGGYPEAWLSQDPEETLMELVDTCVLKDASDIFRIKRPDVFDRLAGLAAQQVGNLVNLAEWSAMCGVDAKTAASYLFVLEQMHIVKKTHVFAAGKRKEVTSAWKAYFLDNRMRNALSGGFAGFNARSDRGQLLENWVFSELTKLLLPQVNVRYWRTRSGAEVDFVLAHRGAIVGIEVKCSELHRPELSRSLWSFIEAYHPDAIGVVNLGLNHVESRGGTPIHWFEPHRLADFLACTSVSPFLT